MLSIEQLDLTTPSKKLLAGESLIFFSSFVVVWAFIKEVYNDSWITILPAAIATILTAIIFAATCIVVMMSLGLYHLKRDRIAPHVIVVALKICLSLGAAASVIYVLPMFSLGVQLEENIVALASLISLITILSLRKYIQLVRLGRLRVLILGTGTNASKLTTVANQSKLSGPFVVVGFVSLPGQVIKIFDSPIFEFDSTLLRKARDLRINEIVFAVDDMKKGFAAQQLLDCKLAGIRIMDTASFLTRNLLLRPPRVVNQKRRPADSA